MASVQIVVKPFVYHNYAFCQVVNSKPNECRKREQREQEEPNGGGHGNCNCLVPTIAGRAVRPPHQTAKNMSEETRMEAIVPADRAWAVVANAETGYSQKERVVCWSRLSNGDVVGLAMRKNGLVRADSHPGFVGYLDEIKPTEIVRAHSKESTTEETSPP